MRGSQRLLRRPTCVLPLAALHAVADARTLGSSDAAEPTAVASATSIASARAAEASATVPPSIASITESAAARLRFVPLVSGYHLG